MTAKDPCDATCLGSPEADRAAERASGLDGHPPRPPGRPLHRGRRARRDGGLRAHAEARRGARRDGRDVPPAARRPRHQRLLRDRAGRGVDATSRASTASATACASTADDLLSMYTQHPPRRLRRRGQAAHHARHLRAVERLLRRLLRPRPARAHEDRRGLHEGVRARRLRRHADGADVAFKIGELADDPLAMYLNDYFTVPMSLAGIPAISIPNGLSDGRPTGFQLAGPAFSETRILDAAYALEQATRLRRTRGRPAAMHRVRSRHRAGDPRPALDADEDVLRLRAELRRAAEHAHLPGLPRPAGRAAGRQRARRSASG